MTGPIAASDGQIAALAACRMIDYAFRCSVKLDMNTLSRGEP